LILVLDIHPDMKHVSAIEVAVSKRHRERAALMERYTLIAPNPLAERLARFDEFAREVYSRDPTAVPAGNKARSSAKAASNVENMHICTEPELVEKVFGRLAPADMELIDRGKIIDCYGTRRLAKRSEAISNRIGETAMRVMTRDIQLCWHRSPPEIGSRWWPHGSPIYACCRAAQQETPASAQSSCARTLAAERARSGSLTGFRSRAQG